MKELDGEGSGKGEKPKSTTAHGSSNATKTASVTGSVGSEEDGVLVDGGGGTNTSSTPSLVPPQTGGKNKKKNKK